MRFQCSWVPRDTGRVTHGYTKDTGEWIIASGKCHPRSVFIISHQHVQNLSLTAQHPLQSVWVVCRARQSLPLCVRAIHRVYCAPLSLSRYMPVSYTLTLMIKQVGFIYQASGRQSLCGWHGNIRHTLLSCLDSVVGDDRALERRR